MAFGKVSSGEDGGDERNLARMMGPGQVDAEIRQALQMIWMMLPANRKNVDEVEREFRRIADRALKSLREDSQHFGMDG